MTHKPLTKQHSGELCLARIGAYIEVFRYIFCSRLAICSEAIDL